MSDWIDMAEENDHNVGLGEGHMNYMEQQAFKAGRFYGTANALSAQRLFYGYAHGNLTGDDPADFLAGTVPCAGYSMPRGSGHQLCYSDTAEDYAPMKDFGMTIEGMDYSLHGLEAFDIYNDIDTEDGLQVSKRGDRVARMKRRKVSEKALGKGQPKPAKTA